MRSFKQVFRKYTLKKKTVRNYTFLLIKSLNKLNSKDSQSELSSEDSPELG